MGFPLPNEFEKYGAVKLFRQLIARGSDGNIYLRFGTSAAVEGEESSGTALPVSGVVVDPTDLGSPLDIGANSQLATTQYRELLVYLSSLIAGENQSKALIEIMHKLSIGSEYSAGLYADFGSNATLNFKASPGQLMSLNCYNDNAADRFIQVHDKTTAASAGDVPRLSFLVKTKQELSRGRDFFGQNGLYFSSGVTFAFSTTRNTYTAGAAADQLTQATIW